MTIQVNVIIGGPSAEHEVSLSSGLGVISRLDRTKYSIRAVFINKNRQFFYKDIDAELPSLAELSTESFFIGPFSAAASQVIWDGCSVAFLALHGTFGEDGVIQGFLDTIGIPYTGSNVMSSAISMDKIVSKFLYIQNGITVPPYSLYGSLWPEMSIETLIKKHGFPCFVKCPQSGSSRLMGRADSEQTLRDLLDELTNHSPSILIETNIIGIEFSCGVLENSEGIVSALPPIEIRPKAVYFDYTAKYSDGGSEEIVPAPYPEELLNRIGQTAIAAHKVLGCSGFSRTDMIYKDDTLFVLETNTLPGLTRNSLLPKAFKAAGGTYEELLDKLIQTTLSKSAYGTL